MVGSSPSISDSSFTGTVSGRTGTGDADAGGIVGDSNINGGGTISGCMALVSELDGGPSSSRTKTVYGISYNSRIVAFSGNYARNDIVFYRKTNSANTGINA
jgi:hypothetical protein